MSYITFDYYCPVGKQTYTRMVQRDKKDEQFCEHDCCGDHSTKLTRLPAGTRTTFRFADTKLKD